MIKLNILPEQRKKTIKDHDFYRMFNKKASLAFLLVSLFGLILTAENIYLRFELKLSEESIKLFAEKESTADKEIQEVNKKISQVAEIQQNSINWFDLISELGKLKPIEVKLSALSMSGVDGRMSVVGYSPSRDALVGFSDKMKASDKFGNIDLPFSALLKQEDIDFDIKGTIKGYESEKSGQNKNK